MSSVYSSSVGYFYEQYWSLRVREVEKLFRSKNHTDGDHHMINWIAKKIGVQVDRLPVTPFDIYRTP